MTQELVRLLLALLATALLLREARRAAPGSRRRLAFSLGACGFALLAAANLLVSVGLGGPALAVGTISVGVALLLGSMLALFLAYRAGEMDEQLRRAGDYVAVERAKREALERERRGSQDDAKRPGSARGNHGSQDDAKRLGERREERDGAKGDKV